MRTIPVVSLVLLFVAPAEAYHCVGYTTTEPDATVPDPLDITGGDLYLIHPYPCALNHDWVECGGWWVYQESNGIPGLQRGDEVEDDTCHGMIRSDTIIV